MVELKADRTADRAADETLVVRAGPLRIVLLAAMFLLGTVVFLAIAVILVVAAYQATNPIGSAAFLLVAVFVVLLTVYLALMPAALASRIEVAPERLRLRLNRQYGLVALPLYDRADLGYQDIQAVESREEFYRVMGLTSGLTAYSLLTRDGRRFRLGAISPQAGWNLPYDEAAALIARRAGMSVTDRGGVRCGGMVRTLKRGLPPWGRESMDMDERVGARSRAALVWQIAMTLVFATIALRACMQG